ncbi:MAG: hypothetical protein WBA16_09805 [Nonlabens sp.]
MRPYVKSLFNLIEIFRTNPPAVNKKSGKTSNCATDFHKDYYCGTTGGSLGMRHLK